MPTWVGTTNKSVTDGGSQRTGRFFRAKSELFLINLLTLKQQPVMMLGVL